MFSPLKKKPTFLHRISLSAYVHENIIWNPGSVRSCKNERLWTHTHTHTIKWVIHAFKLSALQNCVCGTIRKSLLSSETDISFKNANSPCVCLACLGWCSHQGNVGKMAGWGSHRVAMKWFRSWHKCLNGSCWSSDRPVTPGFLELEFNCQKFLNLSCASGNALVVRLHQSNNT